MDVDELAFNKILQNLSENESRAPNAQVFRVFTNEVIVIKPLQFYANEEC